jgi:CRP-like cAMP-binding protein
MEKRTLRKGAALWKQGDAAGTIGIVESGHFGVLVDGRLTGLLWKGMVVGDAALLGPPTTPRARSASVFALTDGATVKEIEGSELRSAFEAGDRFLVGPILVTLVGEIVRNALLLIEASPGDRIVARTMKGLMESTIESFRDRPNVESWDELLRLVGILATSRDFTDRLRAELGVDGSDRAAIRRASDAVRQSFKEHESLADLVALIDAENEKADVIRKAEDDRDLAFLVRK